VSPSTVSQLNQKVYKNIEVWRNLPLEKTYPYVYCDGMILKRCWAGEDGYRKVLGIAEGQRVAVL
jgi:putative transposase